MRAKDVLLTALEEFQGTVVFVSHDRYFIDKLATRVFEVGDGAVHVFPGNYEEYVYRKSNQPVTEMRDTRTPAASLPQPVAVPAQKQTDKERRLNPIKLRQIKERQRSIEDEITRLEVEIADFEQALSNYQSAQQSMEVAELLESRRTDMKNLLAEWEEVSELIEANR
jgi:ATP-binding cassette subfamily F protein 3